MLRINLLPSYVAQRRLTRQLSVLFTSLFGGIVAVMLIYALSLKPKLDNITTQATNAVAAKATLDDLATQTTAVAGEEPPFLAKNKFVKDLEEYNRAYVKLYRNVARYTSPQILYSSLSVTGTTLSIKAYAPSLPDLARYMQIMYNEPDISSLAISAIPGYHSGYTPSSTSYTLPNLPPGFTARFPGSNVPVKSFSVANGEIQNISTGNEVGGQGAGGASASTLVYNPHLGFDFTVTATLKAAITAPPLPGAAAATGVGGPEGPGPPGGYPGGPGGPGGPPR